MQVSPHQNGAPLDAPLTRDSTALSLDAVASHPERARSLSPEARSALLARCAAVLAALACPLRADDAGSMRPQQQPPEPFRNAKEAAAHFGVPETWLRAEARAGCIPSLRLGHYVRFKLSELEAALIARGRLPRP